MKKLFLPISLLLAILLATIPSTVYADNSVDPTADGELGQNVNKLLDQKGFSGSVLIVKDGKTVFQTSRGYSNYSDGVLNDANTAYEIDSVQKSMTAALVMKEVQKKKLRLSDKLHKFYPEIPES